MSDLLNDASSILCQPSELITYTRKDIAHQFDPIWVSYACHFDKNSYAMAEFQITFPSNEEGFR